MRRERARTRSWIEFWLMCLAAYLVLAVAFVCSHFFTENGHVDPSLQLVR